MGEVYLGEDTRLGRKVAIKVLPAEFASDPERLARFEQEARAAAALNHPHIAAVFDVGTDGDTHFIVQEYLDGDTLREPLKKGALPIKKALALATEIAEALTAAHAAGIVHRDLKPENVFITEQGHAKVLDFGLAKLTEMAAPAGSSASMSPTMIGTVAGQVMGTAGYMAPEQIEDGAEVDGRTDLFAFGCVLYEMVGGRQPFTGKNVIDTLHQISNVEPRPVAEINPELPSQLHWILKKCLAKDPAARYQHADDLLVDLRGLASEVEAAPVPQPRPEAASALPPAAKERAPSAWRQAIPWALMVLSAGVAVWSLSRGAAPQPSPPLRLGFELPEQTALVFDPNSIPSLAVAPAGDSVVFSAQEAEPPHERQLWRRSLTDYEMTPLDGTEGAVHPVFSPDGQWIAFFAGDGTVKKVLLAGGAPMDLAAANEPWGLSWGANDRIAYVPQTGGGIWEVMADGNTPARQLTSPDVDAGELEHDFPHFLPGGESLLFTILTGANWETAEIAVYSYATGDWERIGIVGTNPSYLESGHLVYALGNRLFAVGFDPRTRETTGNPIPVVDEVLVSPYNILPQYATSAGGTLAYATGPLFGNQSQLLWRDPGGDIRPVDEERGPYRRARLSPDGQQIAYVRAAGPWDIWTFDLTTRRHKLITEDPRYDDRPHWGPGSDRVAFTSQRLDGVMNIFSKPIEGSGAVEQHTRSENTSYLDFWSAARGILLFEEYDGTQTDIWSVSPDDGDPSPVMVTDDNESNARLSPDGRWLAFMSDRQSGTQEVYVCAFDDCAATIEPVTNGGGSGPEWSEDGTELFYVNSRTGFSEGDAVMVVPIVAGPEFDFGEPREIYRYERGGFIPTHVRGSDLPMLGRTDLQYPSITHINVVLDWFEELKQRVPTGGQ